MLEKIQRIHPDAKDSARCRAAVSARIAPVVLELPRCSRACNPKAKMSSLVFTVLCGIQKARVTARSWEARARGRAACIQGGSQCGKESGDNLLGTCLGWDLEGASEACAGN